ncbi:hypothetical protein DSL92_07790 [Billgrantia gudaonensis]|uniref:Uncharacterized protein n=1 Tax=Billgrantia gudaonensis TaxID=376427 RepID=A0A432JH34_9GAMM|nr:hypothetical protein DSL92_07790 [Halomonas gudaonensis]
MTTTYTLEAGSDRIHLETELENAGDESLDAICPAFTSCGRIPATCSAFPVSAMPRKPPPKTRSATSWWPTTATGIRPACPYFDRVNYEGQDMYREHDLALARYLRGLAAGGARRDLAPVVAAEAERRGEDTGRLSGSLSNDRGEAPPDGLVMIEKEGHPTPGRWLRKASSPSSCLRVNTTPMPRLWPRQ